MAGLVPSHPHTFMTENYPGVHFTPPEGVIDPEATEGEELVKWRKVGDSYTIVEFAGQALGNETSETVETMTADEELDSLAAE